MPQKPPSCEGGPFSWKIRTPIYRMHHERDDWKLVGALASGLIAGVLLCAIAAVLAVM